MIELEERMMTPRPSPAYPQRLFVMQSNRGNRKRRHPGRLRIAGHDRTRGNDDDAKAERGIRPTLVCDAGLDHFYPCAKQHGQLRSKRGMVMFLRKIPRWYAHPVTKLFLRRLLV